MMEAHTIRANIPMTGTTAIERETKSHVNEHVLLVLFFSPGHVF